MLHNLQSTKWEFVPCIMFYGDFNMTHGDLCSVKYMSVVNCFVIMFWEKKYYVLINGSLCWEFLSQGHKVLEFIPFTAQ